MPEDPNISGTNYAQAALPPQSRRATHGNGNARAEEASAKAPEAPRDPELKPESAKEEAPDPFDPRRLRIDYTSNGNLGVERPLLVVPVRKPSSQAFFRVHPDPKMRMVAAVLDLKEAREVYLVTPEMAQAIAGEVKTVTILTCVQRVGGLFLWPLPLPVESGRDNHWNVSARKAAELAETKWVRMKSNTAAGLYDVLTSAHIPDPVWPKADLRTLLQLGFGNGMLIDSETHPIIKQLFGE